MSNREALLHSCGSIHSLLPHLIETGVDVINPVKAACFQMEAERIKNDFGRDITFLRGCTHARHILNHGTVEQVKDDVIAALFKPHYQLYRITD